MVVDKDHLLIDADGSVIDFSDSDTAHVLIVVNGADQHLSGSFRVSLRSGDVVEDRLKERLHILLVV